jgi:hypothetical protein
VNLAGEHQRQLAAQLIGDTVWTRALGHSSNLEVKKLEGRREKAEQCRIRNAEFKCRVTDAE